jgi:hypothetical protein
MISGLYLYALKHDVYFFVTSKKNSSSACTLFNESQDVILLEKRSYVITRLSLNHFPAYKH